MSEGLIVTISIIGGGVALGLLFVAIGWIRLRMTRGWVRTEGVIITKDGGTSGMPSLYPTFWWRDRQGRAHQHTSMVRASLGPSPGTPVTVRYDPDEPSRAVIDSLVQSGRIFLYIGAIIAVLAVVGGSFIGYIVTVTMSVS